ncbi:MAG: metallophosphoesterase [Clostridia bacterium]|nr:metallophosphoesterase [Clostridia bacterium]
MKLTRYTLPSPSPDLHLRIAVASDLHGNANEQPLKLLRDARPDLILIPGDLMDDAALRDADNSGYAFLRACAEIAPTYYSLGNHELACYHKGNPWRHPIPLPLTDEIRTRIAKTGAVLLEDDCAPFGDGILICGLTSGINGEKNEPNADALARFARADGVKILLCHHPEYYVPYVQSTDIALTVCGHAHGGHWRVFGRGVYAPGQGLFPKYTSGVLDGRCVISRGLGNHTWIPRIFNPCELVLIELSGSY